MKFIGTMLLLIIVFATTPAHSLEVGCFPTKDVNRIMQQRYNEVPYVVGVVDTERAMTIYFDLRTGKWSLMIHYPSVPGVEAISCMRGSGYFLHVLEIPKGVKT